MIRVNKKTNFFALLILGLFLIVSAVFTIIEDTNIDLRKAKYVAGQVVVADTREIENFSIRYITHELVFYFRLNNSDQKFVIERSGEAYEPFIRNIKVGDTVKVYYRASVREYNKNVFQIEKGNSVVTSYGDYNKIVSSKIGTLLFAGVLLVTGSIMWYKNFNLIKFMISLVDDKGNK